MHNSWRLTALITFRIYIMSYSRGCNLKVPIGQSSMFLKLTCLTLKILLFWKQIIYNLEENFAKIYLPSWWFYYPRLSDIGICWDLQVNLNMKEQILWILPSPNLTKLYHRCLHKFCCILFKRSKHMQCASVHMHVRNQLSPSKFWQFARTTLSQLLSNLSITSTFSSWLHFSSLS